MKRQRLLFILVTFILSTQFLAYAEDEGSTNTGTNTWNTTGSIERTEDGIKSSSDTTVSGQYNRGANISRERALTVDEESGSATIDRDKDIETKNGNTYSVDRDQTISKDPEGGLSREGSVIRTGPKGNTWGAQGTGNIKRTDEGWNRTITRNPNREIPARGTRNQKH